MIIAKRLYIITKRGVKIDYTHVEQIETKKEQLKIRGETNDKFGMRCNTIDIFGIDELLTMHVEFYVPKE